MTEQHFYMGLTAIPQECKNCPMVGWASRLWGEVIELKIRGQDQVQMSSFIMSGSFFSFLEGR